MRRFLCIYKGKDPEPQGTNPDAVVQVIQEMTLAGVLLAAERCMDSSKGARLRWMSGDVSITEGAVVPNREFITGVLLLQVASKADALAWNKRILQVIGERECGL